MKMRMLAAMTAMALAGINLLATPGLAYFHTTYLFYPFGTTIANHPHTALPALIAATLLKPLTVVEGPHVARFGPEHLRCPRAETLRHARLPEVRRLIHVRVGVEDRIVDARDVVEDVRHARSIARALLTGQGRGKGRGDHRMRA